MLKRGQVIRSNAIHDKEKLENFLGWAFESKVVKDGVLATEPSKIVELWQLRERIAESYLLDGYAYLYDVSLPLDVFYKVVEIFQERLKGKTVRTCGIGHLGDGNLHLNITTREYDEEVKSLIEPYLYEVTAKYKGSISAEHGMGSKKKNFISYSKSDSAIGLMRNLKEVLDPKGILNPYKVLPDKF